MTPTVTSIASALQPLFGHLADEAARKYGFILRQRVFSGSSFLQTCVFGWIEHPDATLEQLIGTAASVGLNISVQGLDQRLDFPAAKFFQCMLQQFLRHAFTVSGRALPLLERFKGTYLDDCTSIALPAELASLFPGCGGSTPEAGKACLKTLLRWEVSSATVCALVPAPGKASDTALDETLPLPPAGSLWMGDLGFFKLAYLRDLAQADVYFISKIKQSTALRINGRRIDDLAAWLNAQKSGRVDQDVELGGGRKARVNCRLIAWQLSDEQASKRRAKMLKDGQDKGYRVSAEALALCAWLVLVSNAPRTLLSGKEVVEVYRVRWQVELVFKTWKSELLIDEWRTKKPGRIMVEIFGKMVGAVVQSWLTLLAWVEGPAKSMRRLVKGMKTVVVKALWQLTRGGAAALVAVLDDALPGLRRLGRLPSRKKRKTTYQSLKELKDERLRNLEEPTAKTDSFG